MHDPPVELVSYLELLAGQGDGAEDHEVLVSLQIDAARPVAGRAIKDLGGGDEWARIDVRATFLEELLMHTAATRTVALVMELLGPSQAMRKAERAATEAGAERALRARIGKRTSARERQR